MDTLVRAASPLRRDTLLLGRGEPVSVLAPRGKILFTEKKLYLPVGGAAITAPGLYVQTFKKLHDGTDLVVDWINDDIRAALFTNSLTPNFSSDTGYGAAPYNANEVSGTGYTAGGVALTGKTLTESPTGTLSWDANDASWAGATFSGARGMLIYDNTLAGKNAIAFVNFGADYGVTAGTFTVQHPSAGIFTNDITP